MSFKKDLKKFFSVPALEDFDADLKMFDESKLLPYDPIKLRYTVDEEKFCPNCRRYQLLQRFYIRRTESRTGRQSWCKACQKEERQTRKRLTELHRLLEGIETHSDRKLQGEPFGDNR